jgi:mannosyltransferase OCH1-like enzyme
MAIIYMKKTNQFVVIFISLFILIIICIIIELYRRFTEQFITMQNKPDELYFGTSETSKIPKIIWTYWHDLNYPVSVKLCIDSWKQHNPDYQINIVTNDNLTEYLPDIDFEKMPRAKDMVQRFADFVRIHLLAKHGGIWLDASIVCNQSFNWVNAVQNKFDCEYIGYYIVYGEDETDIIENSPIIENWFIACVPGSLFMQDWKTEFVRTNEFENANQYLENIKNNGTDISKVIYADYLLMHCSAQVVLQKNKNNKDKYRLCFFNAKLGPFVLGNNNIGGIDELLDKEKCKKYYNIPFIKMVGGLRNHFEGHPNRENIKYYINRE